MIKNEQKWIAEVVQVSLNDYLVLEMFDKNYNIIKFPFISTYDNLEEVVYCVFRTYQNSIDDSRKAVALNMSDNELQEEHPEHSFLIKPYLNACLIGSFHDSKFTCGVQKFNIGIHTRFEITSLDTTEKFSNNSTYMDSLFNLMVNNQLLKTQLKTVCSLLIQNGNIQETKAILLKHLSKILRDDYFLLKDISNYIQ